MVTFDPFAPGFTDDPYPHYAELRAAAPAYEDPLGFWIISRYEDVSRLQRAGHSVDEQPLTRLPRWKSDSGTLGKENRMMRGLAVLDRPHAAAPPAHEAVHPRRRAGPPAADRSTGRPGARPHRRSWVLAALAAANRDQEF
jgi:hypothetical protein